MKRQQRARFITLEGGEGSGKSTQIARLAAALERTGIPFITTREPGGSAAGERIRKLLVEGEPGSLGSIAEVLLHYAARAEHLIHTVHPAMKRGAWVVSDRFADSTLAYQGYGHKVDKRTIEALYRIVCGKFRPDLTVMLDVPVKIGLARAASRTGAENRYERMDTSFHERVRRGFLQIARKDRKRCAVVDASQPADEVTLEILDIVGRKFGLSFV